MNNDLIERLKHHVKHYWGNTEAKKDVEEAIAALSPVLPEDVEEMLVDYRCNSGEYHPDYKPLCNLIERLAGDSIQLNICNIEYGDLHDSYEAQKQRIKDQAKEIERLAGELRERESEEALKQSDRMCGRHPHRVSLFCEECLTELQQRIKDQDKEIERLARENANWEMVYEQRTTALKQRIDEIKHWKDSCEEAYKYIAELQQDIADIARTELELMKTISGG